MPAMEIDVETGKAILANVSGGLSGSHLRPIAVKCIYDIYGEVKIPIIGTGGVLTGEDAAELMMAGATAVGIGTGVYYRGIDVFKKVCDEMQQWMKKNKVKSLDEIRGVAHN